jgi:hypothetical protein
MRTEEAKKITEHNAMTSPLLNLPAEIRNRIFAFAMGGHQVFVSSDPRPWKEYLDIEEERMTHYITGTCPSSQSKYVQDAESLMTAKSPQVLWSKVTHSMRLSGRRVPKPFSSILQACRQFYAETALLPFSRINRFWYSNDDSLKMLIECLKPAQLRAITHLFFTVRSTEDFNFERLENLDKLEGVKRIDVEGADMCSVALEYVETGLGGKIREKAAKGVEVVFSKKGTQGLRCGNCMLGLAWGGDGRGDKSQGDRPRYCFATCEADNVTGDWHVI